MNILYTTNDQFVGKVGAGICSVFENNKELDQIHVFIAGQGITKENCEKFQRFSPVILSLPGCFWIVTCRRK